MKKSCNQLSPTPSVRSHYLLKGITIQEIPHAPAFCQNLFRKGTEKYKNVFIEEFLTQKYVHELEILQ